MDGAKSERPTGELNMIERYFDIEHQPEEAHQRRLGVEFSQATTPEFRGRFS